MPIYGIVNLLKSKSKAMIFDRMWDICNSFRFACNEILGLSIIFDMDMDMDMDMDVILKPTVCLK